MSYTGDRPFKHTWGFAYFDNAGNPNFYYTDHDCTIEYGANFNDPMPPGNDYCEQELYRHLYLSAIWARLCQPPQNTALPPAGFGGEGEV